MLTKEKFLELWQSVQKNGEAQIKRAADVEAVAEKYAYDLITVSVKDETGAVVRELRWEELPSLYRHNILGALLMEYGWDAACINVMEQSDPKE